MRSATDSRGLGGETQFGELEQQVMSLVWTNGPCTAESIREKLDRPLKESTVRTVLRRLEEKGMVAHSVEGRTFLYRAAEARQRAAAKAVQRIVNWLCEGSVEEMLVGLVDSKVLDKAELQRLARKISEAKGDGK